MEKAFGKLSEWSKEPHSKCGVRITSYRGFESLTFRKKRVRHIADEPSFAVSSRQYGGKIQNLSIS